MVMVLVKKKDDDDEYDHNSDDGEKSGDQDFGRGFVVERGYARWWGEGARCGLTCVPPPSTRRMRWGVEAGSVGV